MLIGTVNVINHLIDIPFPPIIVSNNNNKYSDNTNCYEDVSGSIKGQTHNVKISGCFLYI